MSNTAALATPAPAAPNAGMPQPSTPPRELNVALGYGLTLMCHAHAARPSGIQGWLSFSLRHSQIRLGPFRSGCLVIAAVDHSNLFEARIDTDSLHVNHVSFELGSTANADAVIAWAAMHGFEFRRTDIRAEA